MTERTPSSPRWTSRLSGEVSGAFADLGTFLPLTLGVLALGGLDASGVLIGFGLFALATAAIYRRPIPVQPMKAVAAVAIAAGLTGDAIVASGLIVAVVLVALALSGGIEQLSRFVPQSVLAGLQFGIGLHLVWFGLTLMSDRPVAGFAIVALLVVAQWTSAGPFAALAVLATGIGWAIVTGQTVVPNLEFGFHLPGLWWPTPEAFLVALTDVAPGQIVLTLTNAVLATAAMAAGFFPADASRLSPRRLALSTGLLNLALAPFGALPMCHGAGGLAAQHRFGARTGLAPAIFGTACLGLGLLFGGDAVAILMLVPVVVLGAFLSVAGADLAMTRRLFDGRPDCLAVIIATGAACLVANVAVGLAVGLGAEAIRSFLVRRSRSI